ncbi:MAG: hypothetical protein OEZ34_15885 [Spirochaetia bacterium]|nr:hypothetical protein [Spirochaetia bacterium]
MLSVYMYILVMLALQLAVFNIQFFWDMHGALLFSLIFAAGFASALLGALFKNLRPVPLLFSPLYLLFAGILELFIINHLDLSGDFRFSNTVQFLDAMEYSQILKNTAMQFFVSLLVASGLWINRNYDAFTIRKGATDLDEVQKIFSWKEKFIPKEGDNVFKYQKLLSRSFSLVGAVQNEIVGAVHALRIEDTLFFYDFFVAPDWKISHPETGSLLVKSMLERAELNDAGIIVKCAFVRKELEDTLEDYRKCGFQDLGEDDPLLKEIQQKSDTVLSQMYPDWKPLGGCSYFLEFRS